MDFKEKLQILRTQMKISQEELAAQLNISRQSVTKWENGQSFPDIHNLIQLSASRITYTYVYFREVICFENSRKGNYNE